MTNRFVVAAVTALAWGGTASAQNIIHNGDFSSGATSFDSDYPYIAYNYTDYRQTPQIIDGTYTVGPFVPPSFPDWAPFHTVNGRKTQMLVANGAASSTEVVWSQNVTVSPHTTYNISFCLAEIGTPTSVAIIELDLNGNQIGVGAAPSVMDTWHRYSFSWTSGTATHALLALKDLNTTGIANDFVIDNISMSPLLSSGGVRFLHGAELLK